MGCVPIYSKEKQRDILIQIEDHTKADENFYLTAPKILNLANRALEIFESSEVKEKRALVNLLLQNPLLSGRKLLFSLRSPFYMIAECGQNENWLPLLERFGTFCWGEIMEELRNTYKLKELINLPVRV